MLHLRADCMHNSSPLKVGGWGGLQGAPAGRQRAHQQPAKGGRLGWGSRREKLYPWK